MRVSWLLVFMLAAAPGLKGADSRASQYKSPALLQGTIYAMDRKTVLFEFKRRSTAGDRYVEAVRDYDYPNGKSAAQETVTYDRNQLAAFVLRDFQTGATGSVRVVAERGENSRILRFEYAEKPGAKPKHAEEPLRPNTLVADMIPSFLLFNWDRLMVGQEIKCRLVVIPRRETVGFTFRKSSSTGDQGKAVIKMSASSALIAALVEPVFFVIEKDLPHHILEYSGRTTPKIKKDGTWKDLEAVTIFDWAHYTP